MVTINRPKTPQEWAHYDIKHNHTVDLKVSLATGRLCKCDTCYCCELLKLFKKG